MNYNRIKRGKPSKVIITAIWIYFYLIIFEGAFRKWILPSMANEFLLIRDPVALFIIYVAIKNQLITESKYLITVFIIGILSFIATLIFGHGSVTIALFGLRPFILHLPVAFIIGSVFNRDSVIKMGVMTVYLLIPMTILLVLQFYSPQSAWVNRGVGGDLEGSGFGGALGFFRSSGTFSFINGLSLYYGLASAFLFYFILDSKYLKSSILFFGLICTILSIPFTISRTVFFQNILSLLFLFFILTKRPSFLNKLIPVVFIVLLLIFVFSDNPYVMTALDAFNSRFEDANQTEGGIKDSLVNRTFGISLSTIFSSDNDSFFGEGIGMYSNIGIKEFNVKNAFQVADFEWLRIITEMGFLLGGLFVLLRIKIAINFFRKALLKIKTKDYLPWMLLSFGFIVILQAQISQPTSLGFLTLIIGLISASIKKSESAQARKKSLLVMKKNSLL